MTTSFAVSVTPKVTIDAVPGEHLQFTVLHEDIRTSLGGSGDVFGTADDLIINTAEWTDGIHTSQSSAALSIDCAGASTNADLVFIKHTGFLYDATTISNRSVTPSELADTILVKLGGSQIATLANNEGMVIPRPENDLNIASVASNHIAVEVTIIGLVS